MKRKIAIVAGGDSSEHDVSLRSAQGILSFMDKEKYEVTIVELQGADIDTLSRLRDYDYAYITIHGTPGENGLLQGYLDMMHIPYSCCGVLPASMTFNKFACNHYLQNFGYRIARSILLRDNGTMVQGGAGTEEHWSQTDIEDRIIATVGLPCFIKSNVGGSSFGCTKVKTREAIMPAIQLAFKEGNEVICEAFMNGTEVTCGVYKTSKNEVAFPVTEVVSENEFFDYDAKYNGQVQDITPARIPDEIRDKVQALTLRLYDILGCNGIIRVDYILTPKKAGQEPDHNSSDVDINLLEVNTTPGMTATSFIPQQVRAAGLDIKDVLTDIIENGK